ncbi:MAG: hypothetical protein ACYCOU_05940, partial [Sulfobacillus sp.]
VCRSKSFLLRTRLPFEIGTISNSFAVRNRNYFELVCRGRQEDCIKNDKYKPYLHFLMVSSAMERIPTPSELDLIIETRKKEAARIEFHKLRQAQLGTCARLRRGMISALFRGEEWVVPELLSYPERAIPCPSSDLEKTFSEFRNSGYHVSMGSPKNGEYKIDFDRSNKHIKVTQNEWSPPEYDYDTF